MIIFIKIKARPEIFGTLLMRIKNKNFHYSSMNFWIKHTVGAHWNIPRFSKILSRINLSIFSLVSQIWILKGKHCRFSKLLKNQKTNTLKFVSFTLQRLSPIISRFTFFTFANSTNLKNKYHEWKIVLIIENLFPKNNIFSDNYGLFFGHNFFFYPSKYFIRNLKCNCEPSVWPRVKFSWDGRIHECICCETDRTKVWIQEISWKITFRLFKRLLSFSRVSGSSPCTYYYI